MTVTLEAILARYKASCVQGPELMERMRKHAERFETEIIFDHIHTADLNAKPIKLTGDTEVVSL
jgi:thioredoxin reductase (NADPH)